MGRENAVNAGNRKLKTRKLRKTQIRKMLNSKIPENVTEAEKLTFLLFVILWGHIGMPK